MSGDGPGDFVLPPPVSNPDEDDSARILGACLSITGAALVTVAARLYVRTFMIRNIGWDDALMSLAMAICILGAAFVIIQVEYGAGRHIGDVDPERYGMALKYNFMGQPTYLWGICVVKLAVGCSLLRIASTKFWKYLIFSIMGFMGFYTLGCFFTIVFQCSDIRALWDPSVPFNCWGPTTLQALSYTNVSLNILTDLLFALVIPIPMLWKLKVPTRTRIVLVGVLGLGSFACVAACVKVKYLVNYGVLGDLLWDSRNITIWTVVENNVGIIAGSIPALRPLFKSFLGSVYGTGSKNTPGPTGGGYYGKGTLRSTGKSSNWQTLSSGRRRPAADPLTDETSSERAFNAGSTLAKDHAQEEYELGSPGAGVGVGVAQTTGVKTTITANAMNNDSDDSIDGLAIMGVEGDGNSAGGNGPVARSQSQMGISQGGIKKMTETIVTTTSKD